MPTGTAGRTTAMLLNCPVCASSSPLERKHPEVDIYRCPQCDHCFSDIDSISEHEHYDTRYYGNDHRNWFSNPNTEIFEKIYSFISRKGKALSLLDVGCGKGDFLRYVREKDRQMFLTGIDLTLNKSADGICFIQGDFLSLQQEQQYDVVVSMAAIEHVVDIWQFIGKLRDLCKRDGLVVIMTLNDRSILYASARGLSRIGFQGPYNRLYSKHHFHHFNTSSLKLLSEKTGLTILKTLKHNIPFAAVDFPRRSTLSDAIMKIGVWATFVIGRVTGRTYLQTIICRK